MPSSSESIPLEPNPPDAIQCWGLPITADWKTAYRLHSRSQPPLGRLLLAAILIGYGIWVVSILRGSLLAYGLALGVPMLVMALRMIRVRLAIRQIQSKAQRIGGAPEWIFEPARLISLWGANRSELQWSVMDKVSVDDEVILLHPNPRTFYCIPIRFFKNADDAEKVVGFATAAHVPIRNFRKESR